jgi:hypothetical protein
MQYIKHIVLTLLLSLNIVALYSPMRVLADPVPQGCPGSTSPTTPPPAICATIPPGCPGSTQQGPPSPGVQCPYEQTESEPANNPFTPCAPGMAKFQGTGNCVPEAEAQIPTTRCSNGASVPEDKQGSIGSAYEYCRSLGASGLDYSVFGGNNLEVDCKPGVDENGKSKELNRGNCAIVGYIVDFTRLLSGLVGIVIVIMITVGGIQYAAAGPDPGAVVAARKRIINAVIALVLYIFMFSFLQWLIPGGIF